MWRPAATARSIEEWPGDFLLIASNVRRRADAFSGWVGGKAARTGILCCNEHEVGRVRTTVVCAGDMDDLVFQRLSERFQSLVTIFWQLIQEKYAPVSKANLAWLAALATTDQRHSAGTVVWRSEGTFGNGMAACIARQAVQFGHFDYLLL